jgi:DNA repair protein RecN (Recombination protein N)
LGENQAIMLKQLYIKNFTLIDELDIQLFPGFSVITGETGAGKSIILGALSLLLGQRADSRSIKSGCDRCIIEAHFDLSRYQLESLFADNDIDYDNEDCIFRRELTSTGKSRSFINDTPVSLAVMKSIGQQLVDIHSQHQNLLLQEEDFQLNVVDIIAQDGKQLSDYQQAFKDYQTARKAVVRMEEELAKAAENEDFMRFQYNELQEANLEPGQQEELEQESETLSHVEDIKEALFNAEGILSGEEANLVESLREVSRTLSGIKGVFADVAEVTERIDSCYIELKDIAAEVSQLSSHVDYDPKRLDFINDQLGRIYSLEKKHRVETVEELITLRNQLKEQLSHLDNSSEEMDILRQQEKAAREKALKKASELNALRLKAAQKVEKEMKSRLVPLGIPNIRFVVDITQTEMTEKGTDKVAFLFSANTSTAMQPVAQIASGGEIARVMLSLKAMISGTVKLPTIIFDEIDTGVSGRVAEMMAKIMQEMGQTDRQVISITHLPQIAALGRHHYKVYKEETKEGTKSRMSLLSDEERIQEIAQMLSGSDVTTAAINNAKELLKI